MTPRTLRAAADAVRATARRIDLDFEPLAEKGDRSTWEGPAAATFRIRAMVAEREAGDAVAGLRRVADRLDQRADRLQAELVRQEQAEGLRRLEQQHWSERRRRLGEIGRDLRPQGPPGAVVLPADAPPRSSTLLDVFTDDHG